jgi:hypothetical protein
MKDETQALKDIIKQNLQATVLDISEAVGGLVHYVYQIKTDRGIVFAKIRKSHYSALPKIITKPELILYEKKAIEILSKLEPQKFPKLLAYIPQKNLLLLSDIMPERTTVEMRLNQHKMTEQDSYNLGQTLANIHKKLTPLKITIREDGDIEIYNQLLFYRFGYHSHPILDETINLFKMLPKQLILGDLSPKNIGFSTGTFTFCDLENFHYGNTISDIGFLGASIIIHTINSSVLAHKLLLSFLKGYTSISKISINDLILKRTVLGIVLYRLDNPVIPYETSLMPKEKKQKANLIKKILYDNKISWNKLVKSITINKIN